MSNLPVYTILIDDDKMVHLFWEMEAKKQGSMLKTFFSVAEFLEVSDNINKKSNIFVDSNLADNLKGEIESEKIAKEDFPNIYLATGYSADDFEKPSWVKDIVGKRPLFF